MGWLIHFNKFGTLEHHHSVDEEGQHVVQPTYEYSFNLRRYHNTTWFEIDYTSEFVQPLAGGIDLFYGPRFAYHNLIQQTILRLEGFYNNIHQADQVHVNNNNFRNNNNDNNTNNNEIKTKTDEVIQPLFDPDDIKLTKNAVNFNFTFIPTQQDLTPKFPRTTFRWQAAGWSFLMWCPATASFAHQLLSEKESAIYTTMLVSGGDKGIDCVVPHHHPTHCEHSTYYYIIVFCCITTISKPPTPPFYN